jgi:hypothetical protein
MPLDKKFFINTGKDGQLAGTNKQDVKNLVASLKNSDKIVLHFHGGLVSESRGMAIAETLAPKYLAAGAHPVFFVWESGLIETLHHNLHEISREKIFTILKKLVMKYAIGKLTQIGGAKGVGQLHLPKDLEVALELKKLEKGQEPFADFQPATELTELTDDEIEKFKAALDQDTAFQEEIQAIVDQALPQEKKHETTSRGITSLDRASGKTLMSPEVVDELVEDAAQKPSKGIFSTAKMIHRATKILVRTIKRFLAKRDHGLYVTVVEEILRDLYVANVGAKIWGMMKKETADTFEAAGTTPERGGWLFVRELGKLLAEGHRPDISLVGHSTGAVFICHLLHHVDHARKDPEHPWPQEAIFKNVTFLAPACDFRLFADTLEAQGDLFENFRMFAMSDVKEIDDSLVPILYPRSLLYFVSGVVEKEADGQGAFDLPIVGMQRYYQAEQVYNSPEVSRVRAFINSDAKRAVWSVENRGPGLSSASTSHGDFDNDPATIQSLQTILS